MTAGMHRQVWSTKGLPVREQFAFWRELVCRQLITLSYDRDERSDAPFVGEMAVRAFGEARLVEFHAEGRRVVSRGRSELARLREPTCHVYQQLVGTYHYQARGREHVLRPGDLMITAPEVAFEGRPEGDSSFRSWALPPGRLLARLPGGAVPLLHVPRRPGVGELVASMADALAGQADHLGPAVADAALDNLCALIGIAGGTLPDALEGGREAVAPPG